MNSLALNVNFAAHNSNSSSKKINGSSKMLFESSWSEMNPFPHQDRLLTWIKQLKKIVLCISVVPSYSSAKDKINSSCKKLWIVPLHLNDSYTLLLILICL